MSILAYSQLVLFRAAADGWRDLKKKIIVQILIFKLLYNFFSCLVWLARSYSWRCKLFGPGLKEFLSNIKFNTWKLFERWRLWPVGVN